MEIIRGGVDQGLFVVEGAPGDVAAGLLALEEGLVLHLISNNPEISGERVVALFTGIAAQQLNCPRIIEHATLPVIKVRSDSKAT